jgi:acetoin utilization deacetylase AcuC-like enzyme
MPLSPAIAQAYLLAAAGTTLAAQTALASPDRVCVHLGGGFHHAFPGHAEGFCYINDIAIAIRILQRRGIIARALVIDCDLHQGNGTAHIFAKDPDVFTISIHQENLYPQKVCSDIDVGLDDFTGDDEYLEALKRAYPPSLEKHNPALIIFVAGADPYEDDQIGSLQLTKPGLLARDEMVFGHAHRLGIPIIVVLAGGYARNIADTVDIHTQTCHAAMRHCH